MSRLPRNPRSPRTLFHLHPVETLFLVGAQALAAAFVRAPSASAVGLLQLVL